MSKEKDAKLKALKLTLDKLDKAYGKGTVMKMSDACKAEMDSCCSSQCKEIHHLPYETQKALRKGQGNSNDIFKKGRANHLSFKKDLRNILDPSNKDSV